METQRHADSAGQCMRQKDGGWVSVLAFKQSLQTHVTPPPTQKSQNTALTGLIKGQVKVGYFQ